MVKKFPSRLHNRVRIEIPLIQRDEYGQEIKTWQELKTVWADVKFTNGAEYQRTQYQRTQVDFGDASASVRVRLNETTRQVSNGARLILLDFGNQIMAIEAVLPDMATRKFVDFVCRIGRNDGE